MTGRRSMRRAGAALAIVVMAVLLTAGCGGASSDSSSPAAGGAPAPAQPEQNPAPEQLGGDAARGGGTTQGGPAQDGNTPARAPEKLPPDGRSIIYTGTITVEPKNDDVNTAANDAIRIAQAAGGLVGGDNRSVSDDRAEARITLRVPADKFTSVVTELANLGKELSREVKTEDVTEQVVDVTSRIATAQASVDRVRALLARATTLGEIVSLEAEVAKREAELESLKARLNKLTSLAAMSTITAVFVTDAPAPVEKKDDPSGFLAGLKGGWNSFTSSLEVLLTVLGALLPWFIALGIPVLVLVALLRRTANRRYPVTAAPAPAAPADE